MTSVCIELIKSNFLSWYDSQIMDEWKLLFNVILFFFSLMKVDTHSKLQFELWDKDVFYDDKLISCYTYPVQGSHEHTCSSSLGHFEFHYTLTCNSHLTGDKCDSYKPSTQWNTHFEDTLYIASSFVSFLNQLNQDEWTKASGPLLTCLLHPLPFLCYSLSFTVWVIHVLTYNFEMKKKSSSLNWSYFLFSFTWIQKNALQQFIQSL